MITPLALRMKTSSVLGLALMGLALACKPAIAGAQSEHHWADQFGNRATLLNGTVIGGISDLGAVFYNPGRLTRLDRSGFLLAAEAFEIKHVELKAGGGDQLEVEQANFQAVPNLLAGLFTVPRLPKHRFAYSFLSRRRIQSDLLLTTQLELDLLPGFPGDETFLGTWEMDSKLDENWAGLSWAYPATERIGVGISMFGTYQGRTKRFELDSRALPEGAEPAVLIRSREYRYSAFGLLWKAGLSADLDRFRLGLSLTTPQITAFGDGSIRYEELLTTPDVQDGGPIPDAVTVFREKDLPISAHTPFAVGGGVSWVGERAEVHVSGEWYSGVSQYEIMAADSIESQSSGELRDFRVMDELKSVFNFGVGAQWEVYEEALTLYGSVIRDKSAAPEDYFRPFDWGSQVSNSISTVDGYWVGGGVSVKGSWIDLTVGLTYGTAGDEFPNPLDRASPTQVDLPEGSPVQLDQTNWRFLIGFTIPFVEMSTESGG